MAVFLWFKIWYKSGAMSVSAVCSVNIVKVGTENVTNTIVPAKPVTYTITASARVGGTISPAGVKTYSSGSSIDYVITPKAGYQIAKVVIDGAIIATTGGTWKLYSATGGAVYSFENIVTKHTINATFSKYIGVIKDLQTGPIVPLCITGPGPLLPGMAYCNDSTTATTSTSLAVSCSAFPSSIIVGQSATFATSLVATSAGAIKYSWTGACTGTGPACVKVFPVIGTQTTTVTVTSGKQSAGATCSVEVNGAKPPISFDANQPFVPADSISVSNVSSDSVDLAWSKVDGVVGYGVYFDDMLLDTTTATSYSTDDVLMPDTEYEVKVLALGDLNKAEPFLAVAKSKTIGFWSGLWSRLLAQVGSTIFGSGSQIEVIVKIIHT